ncbi:hypothetical protein Hamer_G004190 [Homarus americanus]|uniref:Uncharacterized protein n=1 Tax=Homarus americanus TaxID=6706 RepID=A0A8J5MQ09_HOMAM|nr:hypothetical protein Hamer_G004190 [Homarus americanus]
MDDYMTLPGSTTFFQLDSGTLDTNIKSQIRQGHSTVGKSSNRLDEVILFPVLTATCRASRRHTTVSTPTTNFAAHITHI